MITKIRTRRVDQLKVGDSYQLVLWARSEDGLQKLSSPRKVLAKQPRPGRMELKILRSDGKEELENHVNWHQVIMCP